MFHAKPFVVLDLPWAKRIGFLILGVFIGMAINQGGANKDALAGQAKYYQQHEKKHVEVQKKLDQRVIDSAVANALGQPSNQ